jgi:hypothetical protein
MLNNLWSRLQTAWKDPVWSKIISAAFIGIAAWIWTIVKGYTFSQSYDAFIAALVFRVPIPVWCILAAVAIFYIIRIISYYTKPKQTIDNDSIWSEKIGNYDFKGIYRIYKNEFLTFSERDREKNSVDNLINKFYQHAHNLSKGISTNTINDGGFAYRTLSPRLNTDGLTEITNRTYRLTDKGQLFFSLLARLFDKYPDQKREIESLKQSYVPKPNPVTYTPEQVENFNK